MLSDSKSLGSTKSTASDKSQHTHAAKAISCIKIFGDILNIDDSCNLPQSVLESGNSVDD